MWLANAVLTVIVGAVSIMVGWRTMKWIFKGARYGLDWVEKWFHEKTDK